jgi:cytidylate kinase
MSLICLLGRHGSGKSSIGSILHSQYGYHHLSIGLLRRLASNGQFPSDVPASLIIALKKTKAGHPLPTDVAVKLIAYANTFANCVIDGFPVVNEHLLLLPPHTEFCYIWVPEAIRSNRLITRSESSKRKWTPGGHSEREISLPSVIKSIRKTNKLHFYSNGNSGTQSLTDIASQIQQQL